MKKTFLALLVLTSLVVTGCSGGKYTIKNGQLNATATSMSGHYDSFSGMYYEKKKFTQGERIEFVFSSLTTKGYINAYLMNPSDSIALSLVGDQTFTVPQTGTYQIEVDGDHHAGSFNLTWNDMGN